MLRLTLEEKWELDDVSYKALNEKPFFLTNEDWYYYDERKFRDVLTDKAPKEAIESYEEFYREYEEFFNKLEKKFAEYFNRSEDK